MAKVKVNRAPTVLFLLLLLCVVAFIFKVESTDVPHPLNRKETVVVLTETNPLSDQDQEVNILHEKITKPPDDMYADYKEDSAPLRRYLKNIDAQLHYNNPSVTDDDELPPPSHATQKKFRKKRIRPTFPIPRKIVIATAVCAKFGDGRPLMHAVDMVKSVINSAVLYNISSVDIYLFLEYMEDEYMFNKKFQEFGFKNPENGIQVHFEFIHETITDDLERYLLFSKETRCNKAWICMPNGLKTTEAVMYMDVNTVLVETGNLLDLWNEFSRMSATEFVRVVRRKDTVNRGVLLMDLKRMRAFDWERKLLRVYKYYKLRMAPRLRSIISMS